MTQTYYTKDHEYLRLDGEDATIGITDYAQSQLGDVVFVELPAIGTTYKSGAQVAVVESVKAASEIYAPASGEVVDVNRQLEHQPADVNVDPLGKGWFFKLRLSDPSELSALMDEAAYAEYLETIR